MKINLNFQSMCKLGIDWRVFIVFWGLVYISTSDVAARSAVEATCPKPVYPNKARREDLEGVTTVNYYVSNLGKLEKVEISSSSGHEILDIASMNALRDCKFKYIAIDGNTEGAWASMRFKWRLDDVGDTHDSKDNKITGGAEYSPPLYEDIKCRPIEMRHKITGRRTNLADNSSVSRTQIVFKLQNTRGYMVYPHKSYPLVLAGYNPGEGGFKFFGYQVIDTEKGFFHYVQINTRIGEKKPSQYILQSTNYLFIGVCD